MKTLNEGTIFAHRYRVVRRIGAGGMGAVYEVVHLETERRRALKLMHPDLMQSEELRERFRREARVAAQIESSFIVDVFDAGIDEATRMPFLVMELLRGEELGKRLVRVGRFGFEETVGYLWQTALALDKTHRANIVHRDLKPANLFLCEQDDGPPRIKVLDFGIAKLVAEGGTDANATRSLGTPLYMAPEQFRSGARITPSADIYSLGIMAYTMLVGAPYWAEEQKAGGIHAFVAAVMNGPTEVPTARARRRGVTLPAAFDMWFAQATSRNPDQRFFTATAAALGLASTLGAPAPSSSSLGHAFQTPIHREEMGALPGQTKPGRSGPEHAGPSASSDSGPKGRTVLLDARSATETSGHGLGLSASQPKLGTASATLDVGTGKRGRRSMVIVAALLSVCFLLIGAAAFLGGNRWILARAAEPTVPEKAAPSIAPTPAAATPTAEAQSKARTEVVPGARADAEKDAGTDAGMAAEVRNGANERPRPPASTSDPVW